MSLKLEGLNGCINPDKDCNEYRLHGNKGLYCTKRVPCEIASDEGDKMTLTDLKTTLSTLPDDQLIRMAGEMLGRKMLCDTRGEWFYYSKVESIEWNPIKSLDDAFELVDFLAAKGLYFELMQNLYKKKGWWFARYRNFIPCNFLEISRNHAIVKASILAWNYWKEMGK